jgi:methylated-DNA-[protein]-cysteine S-methyltransferase
LLLLLSSFSRLSHPEEASAFVMGTAKPKGPHTKIAVAVSARHTSTTSTTTTNTTHAKRILAAAAEKYANDATRKGGTGPTPFQSSVYLAVCQVPVGQVTTYKHIATHISCKSSQAVGQALKHNPWAPAVPRHRVVASDLTMGGFFGVTKPGAKMDQKITLLRQEGVRFQDDNGPSRIDPECVYRFDD